MVVEVEFEMASMIEFAIVLAFPNDSSSGVRALLCSASLASFFECEESRRT